MRNMAAGFQRTVDRGCVEVVSAEVNAVGNGLEVFFARDVQAGAVWQGIGNRITAQILPKAHGLAKPVAHFLAHLDNNSSSLSSVG